MARKFGKQRRRAVLNGGFFFFFLSSPPPPLFPMRKVKITLTTLIRFVQRGDGRWKEEEELLAFNGSKKKGNWTLLFLLAKF